MRGPSPRLDRATLALLVAYAAASLLHHVHNAEYLQEYPNLPATLTRAGVYAAWLGEAVIGTVGYLLLRLNQRKIGLGLIAVYALIGFGGLAHYLVAPELIAEQLAKSSDSVERSLAELTRKHFID